MEEVGWPGLGGEDCGDRRSRAENSSFIQHFPVDWPQVIKQATGSPFHLGPNERLRELARTSEAWLLASRSKEGVAALDTLKCK